MTDWQTLVAHASSRLSAANQQLDKQWQLSAADWAVDLQGGTLTFTHGNESIVCPMQVIQSRGVGYGAGTILRFHLAAPSMPNERSTTETPMTTLS